MNKLALLKEWEETGKNLEEFYNNLNDIMGVEIDSPLFNTIFVTYHKYTKTLSKLLNDENEFLEWYYLDNKFGTHGLSAGDKNETREIDSLENLLWIITLNSEE